MNISKQERLNQIEEELKALYRERNDIQTSLSDERKAENLARLNAWGINDTSSMILFAKRPCGYHWWIAKTIQVTEIDFENEYIDSIETGYGEADYEYYVKVEERRIPFSSLKDMEKEFNVYLVDNEQITVLQQHFCNLKLDYQNYSQYESTVAKLAKRVIKIPSNN